MVYKVSLGNKNYVLSHHALLGGFVFPLFLNLKRLLALQLTLVGLGICALTLISVNVRGEFATISFLSLLIIGGRIFIRFATYKPVLSLEKPALTVYEAYVLLFMSLLQTLTNLAATILLWVPFGLPEIVIMVWLWVFLMYDAVFAAVSYIILKREEKVNVITTPK